MGEAGKNEELLRLNEGQREKYKFLDNLVARANHLVTSSSPESKPSDNIVQSLAAFVHRVETVKVKMLSESDFTPNFDDLAEVKDAMQELEKRVLSELDTEKKV